MAGRARPVRVYAMAASGVAKTVLGRECEDTITVNATWLNLESGTTGMSCKCRYIEVSTCGFVLRLLIFSFGPAASSKTSTACVLKGVMCHFLQALRPTLPHGWPLRAMYTLSSGFFACARRGRPLWTRRTGATPWRLMVRIIALLSHLHEPRITLPIVFSRHVLQPRVLRHQTLCL